MKRCFLAVAALLLLCPGNLAATMWCGKGPQTPPDHPCEDDDAAADAAVAKYRDQWMKIPGVEAVDSGVSDRGDYTEIQVTLEPFSLAPSVRRQLPAKVDGFPVAVVPITVVVNADEAECFGNLTAEPRPAAPPATTSLSAEEESPRDPAYYETLSSIISDNGSSWMELPGVVGVGTGKCGECSCDWSDIDVSVQPSMIPFVTGKLPSSISGIPIVIVPLAFSAGSSARLLPLLQARD